MTDSTAFVPRLRVRLWLALQPALCVRHLPAWLRRAIDALLPLDLRRSEDPPLPKHVNERCVTYATYTTGHVWSAVPDPWPDIDLGPILHDVRDQIAKALEEQMLAGDSDPTLTTAHSEPTTLDVDTLKGALDDLQRRRGFAEGDFADSSPIWLTLEFTFRPPPRAPSEPPSQPMPSGFERCPWDDAHLQNAYAQTLGGVPIGYITGRILTIAVHRNGRHVLVTGAGQPHWFVVEKADLL